MRKTHGSRIGELEVERYDGGARNLIEGVGIHPSRDACARALWAGEWRYAWAFELPRNTHQKRNEL